ncbi:MAG: 4-hydroxy-tetrahydrodipicolinate reductase [Candidatus Sericytochromatia bacterium]
MFKVLITGVAGKMGLEASKTIINSKDFEIVGAVGHKSHIDEDIGQLAFSKNIGIEIKNNFEEVLESSKPDLLLDLSNAEYGYKYIMKSIDKGIKCVSGSTGFSIQQLNDIEEMCEKKSQTVIIAPNFSIGAILMMKFSEMASKYFDNIEIIEMHHENKKDSPSGTAIKTAEMISKNNKKFNFNLPSETLEKVDGCRGGKINNINIHSIRMSGFVATQEVLFGGLGQVLTIKHQTINREAYMDGLLFSLKKALEIKGYIYGLENLI